MTWMKPSRRLPAHAGHAARQAAHGAVLHAGPAIMVLARAGYAAKGVVYALIGGLSLLAAVGAQGQTTGSEGALSSLLGHPFGYVVLAVIGLGLTGYALWCFVRAILDPEGDGTDTKGWGKRAFQFGKGVIHAGLVLAVVAMIRTGRGGGGDDAGAQEWTATLLSFPLGMGLVACAGLAVLAYGARQVYRAWTTDLDGQLDLGSMSTEGRAWTVRFSRFGVAARGIVFAVMGAFLVIAAMRSDPSEAIGVGGALRALEQQPYGPVILGVVALGLMSYGAYEFIRAKYRRIEPV